MGRTAKKERIRATHYYSAPAMVAPEILVIDDNRDSRFLLTKTLLRKFPDAILHECESSADALTKIRTRPLAAVVSHRTGDTPGLDLLLELRALNPTVPIVMVSGTNREAAALAAGADRFFLYDEWLRIGTVVDELVAAKTAKSAVPTNA